MGLEDPEDWRCLQLCLTRSLGLGVRAAGRGPEAACLTLPTCQAVPLWWLRGYKLGLWRQTQPGLRSPTPCDVALPCVSGESSSPGPCPRPPLAWFERASPGPDCPEGGPRWSNEHLPGWLDWGPRVSARLGWGHSQLRGLAPRADGGGRGAEPGQCWGPCSQELPPPSAFLAALCFAEVNTGKKEPRSVSEKVTCASAPFTHPQGGLMAPIIRACWRKSKAGRHGA